MPAKKHVAPELIAEGKFLYEETLTSTDDIGARMGLSRSAFYLRVKEWKWKRRRYSSGISEDSGEPILPAAGATPLAENIAQISATAPAITGSITPARRAALYARLYRAAELQMDTVECVQQTLRPTHAAQSERTVRIMAAVNKTLLEIAAITNPDKAAPSDEADDDPIPRDIDEIRNELARRIHALIDAQSGVEGVAASAGPVGDEPERS